MGCRIPDRNSRSLPSVPKMSTSACLPESWTRRASLLCRSGHALFLDTRTFEVRQVPLDLEPADLTLLVVNTGVKHALGNSAYAERVRDCRRAAEALGVTA